MAISRNGGDTSITVADLAKFLAETPEALMEEIARVGLPQKQGTETVSEDDQLRLWPFIRTRRETRAIRENLRLIRSHRGLTRAELARKAGFSERHLARIESGEVDVTRPDQRERLARALNVEIADLCGATDYVGRLRETEPGTDATTQIGTAVSVQTRLAYALLQRRYGWSSGEIIKLAPVLFSLLAEGSLERRRRRLAQLRDAYDKADEGLKTYLSAFERHCAVEETSIENCDLRAIEVDEDGDRASIFRSQPDENPFIDHLTDLANEFLPDDEPAHLRGERRLLARVCRAELDSLAGASTSARWALEYGDTNLAEIPEELLQPEAREQRVQWLEAKLKSSTRDAIEHWQRRLRDRGILCPKCRGPVDPGARFCPRCGNPLNPPA